MALDFHGPATPLMDDDIEAAATELGCQVATIRAVLDVESRGGFLPDKRPKILFERHYFSRLTKRKFDAQYSDISNRTPGGYRGGAAEYGRLGAAMALDEGAALRSASWGAFQIMGDNCAAAGFADVRAFVTAMVEGEAAHLLAFVHFVNANGLADELRRRDWAGFARGYNGLNYAINRYDQKLAAAFTLHNAGGERTRSPFPVLQMGARGAQVKLLQTALHLKDDGDFGPSTKKAVMAFQLTEGLQPDGIAGPRVWRALEL
jgi:hypothetical protein